VVLLDAAPEVQRIRAIQQPAYDSALVSREKSAALRRLKRARQELETQRDALRADVAMKTALIGTLSHEFRTPLTSIFGYTHLLESERYSAEGRAGALRAIRRAATHLHALAENLLVLARRDDAPPEPRIEDVDLDVLAEDLRALLEPTAAGARSTLVIERSGGGPVVPSDPLKLRQILINLVGNALRYAPGDVVARIGADDDAIMLGVIDHGPGLPAAVRTHLYEPLAGGHARGAGLGLAIVKRLVDGFGGSIAVDSRPGTGTQWSLRLPLRAASMQVDDADRAPRVRTDGAVAVLADDDADVRGLVALMLRDLGYRVVEAADANGALDAVFAERAVLAVVDVQMPGLSGNTVAYRLRSRDWRGHIVMLSGHDTADAAAAARAAGADLYLTKPIDPARFAHAIASLP
jgi:signal transduction histidine kinase/CheY-like chemotaxis protein